jgi:hypothetical protein
MNKVTMILLASFCVLSTYPMQKGKTSKESQSSTAKSSRIENI